MLLFLEEQSPKKKPRAPPKVVQPVPLIPTHQRTTRYKESMKKEAKKIAARERRVKKKESRISRKEAEIEKQIIVEVLDKVLDDVDRIRRKTARSRHRPNTNSPRKELRNSIESGRSVRHRRDVKHKTYKDGNYYTSCCK